MVRVINLMRIDCVLFKVRLGMLLMLCVNVVIRAMPEMLAELDKPTDLRVYTIAQASTSKFSDI